MASRFSGQVALPASGILGLSKTPAIVGILTFISMKLHVQHLRDLKQETYSIVSIFVFMSSWNFPLHWWFPLTWYVTWPCSEKVCRQNIDYHVAAFVTPFHDHVLKKLKFHQGLGPAGKIFATMLLNWWFHSIWYAKWPCSEKVEFWPLDPTYRSGWGVCRQNICHHVAALFVCLIL